MRPAFLVFLLGLGCILASSAAQAERFRYVDRHGRTHFINVDQANESTRKFRQKKKRGRAAARKRGPRVAARAQRHPFDSEIRAVALRHRVPVNLVRAVVKVESNFNPRARSFVGAMGLMQLMPATAQDLGVKRPFDPRENLDGGTRYLAWLTKIFGGDLVLVLAGYHAGPGAVLRNRGVPPYKDTRAYVKNVLAQYYRFSTN